MNNAIDALEQKFHQAKFSNQPLSETPSQTPTIWLHTELTQPQSITLRVKDNGVGLSDVARQHVFEPFFTTKPVGQGVGLGLATSYQIIVQKHRGHLSYVSTPGEGTEFVMTIPITFAGNPS